MVIRWMQRSFMKFSKVNEFMSKGKIYILSLLLLILPSLLPFFSSKFFYTQDYIFIARLNQMTTALSDGQFPVRWAPDLRFGEPLFNFYAPLPYYLGGLLGLLGLDFILIAKILFILSTMLSALTIYIFCKKMFNNEKASLLAAVFYTYAPYRAVDIYVRGALSECFAFVFFPLIFYCSLLISEDLTLKRISLLALSLSGLFLTHNVTALMFLPFLAIWWVYLILKKKDWKLTFPFALSSVLGIGLSAFFLLPAFFERDFIQTKYLTVGYFNFRAHFVAIGQFFSTFWGYGSSLWGLDDGLSFQIGLVHWAILILALIVGFIYRKNIKLLGLLVFLGGSFLLSIFLQHNKSAFIWEALPIMSFIQFPWRFLAISVFLVSITGALVGVYLAGRLRILYLILISAVLVANISYFRPKEYADNNFFDKFLNKEIMRQGRDLTKDYLPIWVQNTDIEYFSKPQTIEGEIEVLAYQKKSTSSFGKINVKSDKALIEFPISYFPGWEVKVNGSINPQAALSDSGLIRVQLSKGIYNIVAEFKDTQIRTIGNSLTLFTFALMAAFLGYKKVKFR